VHTRSRARLATAATIEVMYSPQVLDHFENPRNAGDLLNADADAQLENPACGDVLRLTLKITADRITEAAFRARGCVPAMACGSALTELAIGATLEKARGLRREDVIARLGSLPQASTHAAQLAIDTLAAALQQIKS
jgi:nitrogen fixation protein NifU and related proteins